MKPKPKTVLLIGFDRSGSSMIAKLLEKHPKVNLIFQPFNSSELTKKQWEIWESNHQQTPWFKWFSQLEEGELIQDTIQSQWFFNHSSSYTLKTDQLNLIKDTKLHFKVQWLQNNFPNIEIFGIWRDPRAILRSLVRNNFHQTWYKNLDETVIKQLIRNNPIFKDFEKWLDKSLTPIEIMALGIALRTYYLNKFLPPQNWISYHDILNDANLIFNQFTANWNLKPFDFIPYFSENYNIAGKPFEGENLWESFFDPSQLTKINEIFAPILNPE